MAEEAGAEVPTALAAVWSPVSAESTAALESYFLSRAGYEGLRDMVTPDGYLRVDTALSKWSLSNHTNFYDWCRSDMNNVRNMVDELFGIALIGGEFLIWPRNATEAVGAWGPGGDGPWETGAFELCWEALLDNATLLDNKTPLFKHGDTPEGGEWLVVLAVASALSLTPGFEPMGQIEATRLLRYWTWMCRDILELPESDPESAAKDAARRHLELQISLLLKDPGPEAWEDESEMIELMAFFDSQCGMEDKSSAKRARLDQPSAGISD